MYILHAIEKVHMKMYQVEVHKSVQQRTMGMMTRQSKNIAQTRENLSIVLMSKNLNVPCVMVAGVNGSFDYVHAAEHFLHILFAGALWSAMLLE